MKANESTTLHGSKVILVPYRAEHVPKYHEWMSNEQLRDLTASEPLSLEEEYEMQQKWQLDEDKLTFIILVRLDASAVPPADGRDIPADSESFPMIGDVNMFFNGSGDEFTAELEIMIAGKRILLSSVPVIIFPTESAYRRQGLALETLQMMIEYTTGLSRTYFTSDALPSNVDGFQIDEKSPKLSSLVPPSSLLTRVSLTNDPSIKLFEKLGFQIVRTVEVFGEVEMRWRPHPKEP